MDEIQQQEASTSSEQPLVLYFLPVRGHCEAIRMILHYGELEFQDVVIALVDWDNVKKTSDIAPFGQLPSLRLPSGEIIAQSGAIVRYVAKLAKIYPTDPAEAARADMIYEFAQEFSIINPLLNFYPVLTDEWSKAYSSFFGEELPQQLSLASNLLGTDNWFFGGSLPHHGDFELFHCFDSCLLINSGVLDNFPLLQAYYERMKAMPAIQHYLENRLPIEMCGFCGSYIQTHIAKNFNHHHKH
jgi:glutathione S-transferase